MTKPPATHDPTTCWLCQRRACGLGIGNERDPRWLCEECALLAEDIRRVKNFDAYETKALEDAGADGGAYLEGIHKTDLADLSEGEYSEFVMMVIKGFGDSLRRQIRERRAPF